MAKGNDGYVGLIKVPASSNVLAKLDKDIKVTVKEVYPDEFNGLSTAEFSFTGVKLLSGVVAGINIEDSVFDMATYTWSAWSTKFFSPYSGKNIADNFTQTVDSIKSGYGTEGFPIFHRFRISFVNVDNIPCFIDGTEFISGSFGTLAGSPGNKYIELTVSSVPSVANGSYVGRKVDFYTNAGSKITSFTGSHRDFVITKVQDNKIRIFVGDNVITDFNLATQIKLVTNEIIGDRIYLYGSDNSNTIYGIPFNGVDDFGEMVEVNNLCAIIDNTPVYDDDVETSLKSDKITLRFDNMYGYDSPDENFLCADGSVKKITASQFKGTAKYVALMFTSKVNGDDPYNHNVPEDPHYADYQNAEWNFPIYYPGNSNDDLAKGIWTIVAEIPDQHLLPSEKATYEITINNLPLGKTIGFWVGAVSAITKSNAWKLARGMVNEEAV
ncbi:MAG: hypothetical protein ACM34K_17130 [Bacillota bacterium]